jgi:voltage-gated potassium channel
MTEETNGWRAEIRALLEGHHPRFGRAIPFLLQGLIIFSLLSIAIESLQDLPVWAANLLYVIEVATVVIFTIEYILRIAVAERPLRYIFSFFGIVDLLAVLPFYLTLGGDYRAIRAVRLIRLFWLFKIARYTKAFDNIRAAIYLVRRELIAFATAAVMVIYVCGVGIYIFEHDAQPDVYRTIFDGLWWAVVTLTTVGYGDVYPITAGGRLFTGAILFVGLGIIAIPTGLVSSALTTIREEARKDEDSE